MSSDKKWLDYTLIRTDQNGVRWVNEKDAFRKVESLQGEVERLKAEIKRLHDKYDLQLLVKRYEGQKSEVERLRSIEHEFRALKARYVEPERN